MVPEYKSRCKEAEMTALAPIEEPPYISLRAIYGTDMANIALYAKWASDKGFYWKHDLITPNERPERVFSDYVCA